ncbi:hypothetical protein DFP72DRAFT_844828 [Ephemerocybe angulata]|uniref:Uncharacterized protein n=1 Tax=Ephemerocybe angulata TaxID=980116 RepID=A0A8H6I7S8_9AGAR|nr:hypothetical protein DFP72DRAFT_844828 [Tulosesus angulatus]
MGNAPSAPASAEKRENADSYTNGRGNIGFKMETRYQGKRWEANFSAYGDVSFERRKVDDTDMRTSLAATILQSVKNAPAAFAMGAFAGLGLLVTLLYGGGRAAMVLTYELRFGRARLPTNAALKSRSLRKYDAAIERLRKHDAAIERLRKYGAAIDRLRAS